MLSANPSLLAGSGISGILHKAAGNELEKAAKPLGPLSPGQAVITPAFNLPAKYVVHTVCPRYIEGTAQEKENLAQAYRSALGFYNKVPDVNGISFVSMGTGIYKWPQELAAEISVRELMKSSFEVTTVCVLDNEVRAVYRKVYEKLKGIAKD